MKKSILITGIITIFVSVFGFVNVVHANPSLVQRFRNILSGASEVVATSTPQFLIAGTATSTIYADFGQNESIAESATLAIHFVASSTTSTLGWRLEYADETSGVNCYSSPTACDWYSDNFQTYTNASTTLNINIPKTYSWNFSSSTDWCSSTTVLATNNRGCKMLSVPTPSRYTRAVFYLPAGSTRGSVWGSFIAKKQNN